MILSMHEYKNKIQGCWTGKNIGGTLGAPFECRRGVVDLEYYTQELHGEPLPNDDLDLQLVWLNATEKYGRNVNAPILGEYWHSYIFPNWGEYGAGKNNMRMGLLPPLSGYVNNVYRDSCGAFILSEIWACLAPGHPEIAVRYAYEDAIVNHSHEGVYAEVFCAAIESAAFAESNVMKLIDIGLSYIPADSGVARSVRCALDSHSSGLSWKEARKSLLNAVPGSFGALGTSLEEMEPDIPVGQIGWDAPSNIGIIIIGWLYGGGDFGKSVCIAAGCCEDADCTAGTLGAILGIIGGAESIPERWTAPLGGKIKTFCINRGDQGLSVPNTIDEMAQRILRLAPVFLGGQICDFVNSKNGFDTEMNEGSMLFNRSRMINAWSLESFEEVLRQQPFGVRQDFVIFNTMLDYRSEPFITEGVPKKFELTIRNNLYVQQWLTLKWHLPEGWELLPGPETALSLEQNHCNIGSAKVGFTVIGHNLNRPRYDAILEISSLGRHTNGLIPVVLLNCPDTGQ